MDLLCFHAFGKLYGIPLELLKETFDEVKITAVPQLHPALAGLCNHNGIIYPVLSFSRLCHKEIPDHRTCMLLLEVGIHSLILRMNDVPFIIYERELDNKIDYDGELEDVKIKQICQRKEGNVYVLDMEAILADISEHIYEGNEIEGN